MRMQIEADPTSEAEPVRLSLSQRLHFDVYGYVLLERVLAPDEIARMKEALYRMKADPNLAAQRVYTHRHGDHHTLFGHLVEYDPALLEYAVHPRLIPLVEEVVGGAVRLEESEAIINRRRPDADLHELRKRRTHPTGFHTGTRHGWGTYFEQNRFHSLFCK